MGKKIAIGLIVSLGFLAIGGQGLVEGEELGSLQLKKTQPLVGAKGFVAPNLQDKPKSIEGEAVVKFKPGETPEALKIKADERAAMSPTARIFDTLVLKAKRKQIPEDTLDKLAAAEDNLGVQRTALFGQFAHAKSKDKATTALVEGYKGLSNVEYAEPNFIYYASKTPNDPLYSGVYDPIFEMRVEQWNLNEMGMEGVWDQTTGRDDVIVAVIDSGVGAVGEGGADLICYDEDDNPVSCSHPDLFDKTKNVPFKDYVYNIRVGGVRFVLDDCGHGSHVGSIAAAVTNNNQYLAGVSWGGKLMPIKVLFFEENDPDDLTDDTCSGYTSDIIQAIVWAADNGADIINLSLGGSNYSQAMRDAIDYAYNTKKVLVVAAVGNEFEYGNQVTYPAAYPYVLAVGAVDDQDRHASYSNTGSYVDVVAYGGDASGGSDSNPRHWIPGAYWQIDLEEGTIIIYHMLMAGTSQAAPHVSGLAALLLSVNGNLNNSDLADIVTGTAIDLGSTGRDDIFGFGLIEPARAVAAAQNWGQPTATPTLRPTLTPTLTPSPTPIGDCGINVDCVGGIDYQDIGTWRRYWALGDERAELNESRGINILDYLLLLRSWF